MRYLYIEIDQLILNGNEVSWTTVSSLLATFPSLTELRLSNNNLATPDTVIRHLNIREIFLSLNTISDFSSVMEKIIANCPRYEQLDLEMFDFLSLDWRLSLSRTVLSVGSVRLHLPSSHSGS